MKKFLRLTAIFIATLSVSCSKDDDNNNAVPGPPVNSETVEASAFHYKQFFQETENESTRKGIVILAHGDGTDENDGTLNDQCIALAQQGYVAITTSYAPITGTIENQNATFKNNMEEVITQATADFEIPRSKVILGGLSRGGNGVFALVLPAQAGITPIAGIKGVILECSGGDNWKGSAILFPVAYMSTLNDDVMGSNANEFKSGLQDNMNPGVSAASECLIINGTGHCTEVNQYKAFVVRKVQQWLP